MKSNNLPGHRYGKSEQHKACNSVCTDSPTRITTPIVAAALRMLCPAQAEITRGVKATLWLRKQKVTPIKKRPFNAHFTPTTYSMRKVVNISKPGSEMK